MLCNAKTHILTPMFGRGRLHFERYDTIITNKGTGSTTLRFPDLILMSRASTAPKIIKQITKISDSPILDPRIRIFKTDNKLIQFQNNPNLDPKIRFFTVTKDAPGFPVGGGAWNKNHRVTSGDRLRVKLERLEREKSHQAPYSTSESVKAGDRDLSQGQPQAFLEFKQEAFQKDPEPSSDIRVVADALEARKREQDLRNESRIITNNMSSELTKVLTKDACPRK